MKKYLKHIVFSALIFIMIITVIIKYRQKNRASLSLLNWNTGKSDIVKFSYKGKIISSDLKGLKTFDSGEIRILDGYIAIAKKSANEYFIEFNSDEIYRIMDNNIISVVYNSNLKTEISK